MIIFFTGFLKTPFQNEEIWPRNLAEHQDLEHVLWNEANFEIEYQPDFRQKIADSWPGSIDDSRASEDWGWSAKFGLSEMAQIMLDNVQID